MNFFFRYSTLKLVTETNINRAVSAHFEANNFTSEAMTRGTAIHEMIEKSYLETGKFPEYLHNFIAKNLQDTEQKAILEERKSLLLFDNEQDKVFITGAPDCVLTSSKIILDWKSTVGENKGTSIGSYLSSGQIDTYSLFYEDIFKGAYIKLDSNNVFEIGVKLISENTKKTQFDKLKYKAEKLYEELKTIL
jgi:hypothetical protein